MPPYRPFAVRLTERVTLSPSFVRITLTGPDLGACGAILLDQRVKLVVGTADVLDQLAASQDWFTDWRALGEAAPPLRTYTLSAVRPNQDGSGAVDIDVVLHDLDHGTPDDAPGARYAATAPLGTPALLVAADRNLPGADTVGVAWHGRDADEVLLIGDETALPAIINICATLRQHVRGRVIVEIPQRGDVRDMACPHGVDVHWCVRADGETALALFGIRPHEFTPVPRDELVWDEPEADTRRCAWLAGEAAWVKELRGQLTSLGYTKAESSIMGYWRRGSAGR